MGLTSFIYRAAIFILEGNTRGGYRLSHFQVHCKTISFSRAFWQDGPDPHHCVGEVGARAQACHATQKMERWNEHFVINAVLLSCLRDVDSLLSGALITSRYAM